MSISLDLKSVRYGKKTALSNIKMQLPDGTFTAVIGRNGSGKSTLAGALLSLLPYDGELSFDGVCVSDMTHVQRALAVSGILQRPRAPHITVRELAEYGRSPHIRFGGRITPFDTREIERALERASALEIHDKYLDSISGGELKRAYFAMLLSQDAKNVVLDEATASMDADYESEFIKLSAELAHSGGRTVVAVMHNLDLAVRYADYVLLLESGQASFFGRTDELLKTELIERAFNVKRVETDGRIFFCS